MGRILLCENGLTLLQRPTSDPVVSESFNFLKKGIDRTISTGLIAAVLIGRPVFKRHLKRLDSAVCVSMVGCRGW